MREKYKEDKIMYEGAMRKKYKEDEVMYDEEGGRGCIR